MSAIAVVTLVVVGAVIVIGLVSSVSSRIGIAAPIVLVVVGLALGLIPGAERFELDPELVLTVVLPPLLYAAARRVPFVDFRRNIRAILLLAVVLVVVSAFVTAGLVSAIWGGVGFALALALGAVVSPPDPVAATSLARRLGLPPRIVTILEGEGLINDATALVLLASALSIAELPSGASPSPVPIVLEFLWAVIGATAIGVVLGIAAVRVRERVHDQVLDTAIALSIPFLAYLGADAVGASGIVGVVAAGIAAGHSGPFRIRAPVRITEDANWRLVTNVVANGVFLYVGIQLVPLVQRVVAGPLDEVAVIGVALLVTLVLVVVRFAAMPAVIAILRHRVRTARGRFRRAERRLEEERGAAPRRRVDRFRHRHDARENDLAAERDQVLGWRDAVILGMSGMRGVVTVAAVQTLPDDRYRSGLVLIAYIVAILTLLSQGLTLPFVARRIRPPDDEAVDHRAEIAELRSKISRAGSEAVDRAVEASRSRIAPGVVDALKEAAETHTGRMDEWGSGALDDPRSRLRQFHELRERSLSAQRAALRHERDRGEYSSDAVAFVGRTLDSEELQLRLFGGESLD